MMKALRARLLVSPGKTGVLFGDLDLPAGLISATVHRGRVQGGPRIVAPSAGNLLPPQVEKIKDKLSTKVYDTSAPLELFAYSTHDEVDGYKDAMKLIDACVTRYLPGSRFRRVRVFDFGFGQLKYTHPLADPSAIAHPSS